VDRVRGRVAAANGVRELNTAVSSVIASIGMELVDGQLSATFRLHIPKGEEPGIAGTGFSLTRSARRRPTGCAPTLTTRWTRQRAVHLGVSLPGASRSTVAITEQFDG
jgi:hypothetical protein